MQQIYCLFFPLTKNTQSLHLISSTNLIITKNYAVIKPSILCLNEVCDGVFSCLTSQVISLLSACLSEGVAGGRQVWWTGMVDRCGGNGRPRV